MHQNINEKKKAYYQRLGIYTFIEHLWDVMDTSDHMQDPALINIRAVDSYRYLLRVILTTCFIYYCITLG